ncbi:MAG: outer membrane beta-barrel protein [Syntrophobacteraceae bacterium]|jgi:outer membrane immunogenic protein
MRNSVLATALLVLFLGCGSAWAADPAAATYNWTGFYAGLNTGFAKDAGGYSITSSPSGIYDTGDFADLAFIFGGQVGYNFQCCCCPYIVYGIEADINYDGMGDSVTQNFALPVAGAPGANFGTNYTVTQEIDFFGTLRGRLGYTPADRLLFYITGGLAYGEVSSSTSYSVRFMEDPTFFGSSSGMLVGWCAGAGGEYAINNCWSVKLEYLYVDLGSMSYPIAGTPLTTNISTAQNVFRVGLNYKF